MFKIFIRNDVSNVLCMQKSFVVNCQDRLVYFFLLFSIFLLKPLQLCVCVCVSEWPRIPWYKYLDVKLPTKHFCTGRSLQEWRKASLNYLDILSCLPCLVMGFHLENRAGARSLRRLLSLGTGLWGNECCTAGFQNSLIWHNWDSVSLEHQLPIFPCASPWKQWFYSLFLWVWLFYLAHISGIMQDLPSVTGLFISPSIVSSTFIHVLTCGRISFFLLRLINSPLCERGGIN